MTTCFRHTHLLGPVLLAAVVGQCHALMQLMRLTDRVACTKHSMTATYVFPHDVPRLSEVVPLQPCFISVKEIASGQAGPSM